MRGLGFFRTVVFLPQVVALVVVGAYVVLKPKLGDVTALRFATRVR